MTHTYYYLYLLLFSDSDNLLLVLHLFSISINQYYLHLADFTSKILIDNYDTLDEIAFAFRKSSVLL